MKRNNHIRQTTGDYLLDIFVYVFIALMICITLYPLIYTFSISISDPYRVAKNEVYFLPKGFSMDAINKILENEKIWRYYGNTIKYTVCATALGVFVTALAAYPISRREFSKRGFYTKFMTFTMFFSGGLIPSYIVTAKLLHLYNTIWAIILPGAVNAWYILVTKAFFESLPNEIVECARLDGASEFRIFGQLVVPLSKPVLAVIALYYAVGRWNSYFSEILYLSDQDKWPLSIYIQQIVIQNANMMTTQKAAASLRSVEDLLSSLQLKYAVIVVSVLPLLLIYPFISKNLEKGLMIGAIKG